LAAGPKDSVDFIPATTSGDQSLGRRQMDSIDSIDAGRRKALFGDEVDSIDMRLLSTKSFDRGTVLLTYAPAGVR
jgi:hypothetical protein